MQIKNWITREVITVTPDTSVKQAFYLMKSMGIRHLPVVKDGILKGMVTDRDLRRPKLSDVFKSWDQLYRLNDEIQVEDVMVSPALTVKETATLQEAAQIMAEKRIGALPVTDKAGKLNGIITESDLLRAFVAGKQ
ncbi:MAG: CBS domain-containing protein [Candidatus Omnitrophica bacterium]|nr:CBS domain-containing protein [Candidatus Omnitrophota bacterium]